MNLSRLLLAGLFVTASVALGAKIVTKPVAYEHAGTKLEGYLAYDDAKVAPANKAAGVLVVPEWWGLNDYTKGRVRQLAELGYVAFGVDMYGAGVATEDPKKAGELAGPFYGKPLMAERAQAALDQLLGTGLVDRGRVAAIGYCFGGSTVQALAYSGAPLAGIVSFHGGLIPVPAGRGCEKQGQDAWSVTGAVDPFIKPEEVVAFQQAMNAGKFDYQFISYAGAVHAFTNPGADAIAKATGLPIAYNAAADKRSWELMRSFFREVLDATKP